MPSLLSLCSWCALIVSIRASYNGPFVLWGRDELSQIHGNSLNEIDEKFLRDIYSDSSAIILFVRNASNHLNEENFPIFKDLLSKSSYAYLTQQHLGLDPMEFNLNAEVISLVGPTSQQDVELSALYRDSVITYGDGKVLGILATKTTDHEIRKRATTDESPDNTEQPSNQVNPSTTSNQGNVEPEPSNQTDYVFYPTNPQSYKILLYTSEAPSLFDGKNITKLYNNVSLTITTNSRNNDQRILKVRYNYKERERLSIEYVFNVTSDGGQSSYWTLIAAEIDNKTLSLGDDQPAAPIEFSYKCSRKLKFGNSDYYLEFSNIQVQADVNSKRFNDSYDCIGFTSAPIWSGIFISFIICSVVAVALNQIMEIKPPNRFENSRGKQLTFTISE